MAHYRIQLEPNPTSEDCKELTAKLAVFNASKVAVNSIHRVGIFVRDHENMIRGGIIGYTKWNWLSVDVVWLSEDLRGRRMGSEMLARIEQMAIQRGCVLAHLDTFDFQALGFYQKQGYEIFAILDDYPKGHQRFYLKKELLP
jgi:ribosomal protein S18 acetylase RimI-like enzyme